MFSTLLNKKSIIPATYKSFHNEKILDSSKLREFAEDNFGFDENGRKSSEKIENNCKQFLLFIHPSKKGRIMLSPVAGGVPHSLSGAYLQDYASYGYETSWVDRSHQNRVQCTGTITLACLIFELLPFVYFHT